MNVNIPSSVRSAMYLASVFASTFIGVVVAAGVHLSIWVVAGVSAFNAVVAIVARVNVTPDTTEKKG